MIRCMNVLFLAPPGLDIYKDVIKELECRGFYVDYVSSSDVPKNPFMPIFNNRYNEENVSTFEKSCTDYWREKLFSQAYLKKYDIFLTINGLMVCPFLFQHLKARNPNIKCKLFLYDKIEYACRVDRYFSYYDAIFSFDLDDAARYNLRFLPIYWVPISKPKTKKYDIFGMASYSLHKKDRALLFRQIRKISKKSNMTSHIKLYVSMKNWPIFFIKNTIKLLTKHKSYIPFRDVFNGLITNKSLSPTVFREYIYESDATIDTHVEYQDGLTARFMWALGAEKKIITTNKIVKQYEFYSPDQFFIIGEDSISKLNEFINAKFSMSLKTRATISQYRIDNWLDVILKS